MIENTTKEKELIDNNFETIFQKPKAEKREIISISVSAEEKRRISVEALKDYSTTVSDLIRTRMFIKHDKEDGKEIVSKTADEEIEVYKDVIQQLKTEIESLNEKNSDLLLQLNDNLSLIMESTSDVEIKPNNEGVLLLEFSTINTKKSIIQKIKEYRSELFNNAEAEEIENFYDFEKFAKVIFLRGLKRSYNNGLLKEDTGLRISEVEDSAQQEEIDYSELV